MRRVNEHAPKNLPKKICETLVFLMTVREDYEYASRLSLLADICQFATTIVQRIKRSEHVIRRRSALGESAVDRMTRFVDGQGKR